VSDVVKAELVCGCEIWIPEELLRERRIDLLTQLFKDFEHEPSCSGFSLKKPPTIDPSEVPDWAKKRYEEKTIRKDFYGVVEVKKP
jgi:hypothetical protein